MKLWDQEWFKKSVTTLRKWGWFDEWIYGYSKDLEDFVHNPGERLRDDKFPFAIKDVDPKVILFRYHYIPNLDYPVYRDPKLEYRWGTDTMRTSLNIDKWVLKYPNAKFMFQAIVSWKGWFPIPFVSINYHIDDDRYFQFGAGWGPQWANYDYRHPERIGQIDAVLCGKFRFPLSSEEALRNPTDQKGLHEGDI